MKVENETLILTNGADAACFAPELESDYEGYHRNYYGACFDEINSLVETWNNRNWLVLYFFDENFGYGITYYTWNSDGNEPYIEMRGTYDPTYWTPERQATLIAETEALDDITCGINHILDAMAQYDLWKDQQPSI